MTKAFSSTPLWPYVVVVSCLLVLTVFAPRSWRKPAREPTSTLDVAPPTIDRSESNTVPVARRTPTVTRREPSSLDSASTELTLEGFSAPRQIARIVPPVTERVDFDAAISEPATLPSPDEDPELPYVSTVPRVVISPSPTQPDLPGIGKNEVEILTQGPRPWPLAKNLLLELDQIAQEDHCREWAMQVRYNLVRLHEAEALDSSGVAEYLASLEHDVVAARQLSETASTKQLQGQVLRVRYALARRVALWQQIYQSVARTTVPVAIYFEDDAKLKIHLTAVTEYTESMLHGDAWRQYLQLDELTALADVDDSAARRLAARRVLLRMESPKLDAQQREVMARTPFSELSRGLQRWACEPVDYLALLNDIEAYEEGLSQAGATSIARHFAHARWSPNATTGDLGDALNTHYRNANIRVAVSSELINRMLPKARVTDEDINERILGARVYGTSQTSTDLKAVLVPDSACWRVGLEAAGEVASETAANSGPATFYNEALSRYLARKLLIVDHDGLHVWRAEADAESNAGLTGLRTDYDRLPVIGWIARNIALNEHDNMFYSARRAAEVRLAERAGQRLDQEVQQELEQAEADVNKKLLAPLEALHLEPVALDLHTTAERLIGRYRVAGNNQLGAHTPRPRAPSDSLLSVQVHESALNNALENMKLEGKRSDLRQLYQDISTQFGQTNVEVPEDVPEGVVVEFAKEEAIRVRADGGRVQLTIRIAALERGRRHQWDNFTICAYYVPDPSQLDANLVREGSIELSGRRITSGDRIALSGIFSKVLSRTRPFKLINRQLAESADLQDLKVTQFVINDGWLGIAFGPQPGEATASLAEEASAQPIRR